MTLREIWDVANGVRKNFVHRNKDTGEKITCKWDVDKGVFIFSTTHLPISGWEEDILKPIETTTLEHALGKVTLDQSLCLVFCYTNRQYFEGNAVHYNKGFKWLHSQKWYDTYIGFGNMVEIYKIDDLKGKP